MDNSSLLNYALKRRNFLVAMWLMLQQRWFIRSFNASARIGSWFVIVLGMSLVTLTVVTLARNVVPVLTTPNTLPYILLQLLVLIVSFNIYMNYLCATAFSRRLGVAPADYVYTDRYGRTPGEVPTDDSASTTTSDEDEEEGEEEREREGRHRENPVRVVVSSNAEARPMVNATTAAAVIVPSSQEDAVTAAVPFSSSPLAQPHGGIQVVRVFDGAPPADNSRGALNGTHATPRAEQPGGPQQRRTALSTAATDMAMMEEENDGESGVGVSGQGTESSSLLWRRGGSSWMKQLRLPCQRIWRRVFPNAKFSCPACTCAATPTVAPLGMLRELERIAAAAERYGPRQRGLRVLDAPRRYCHHCRRLKAPREHHCAICNECVAKMDHHCPWINNCVGMENQRYFLLFVAWLWLGTLLASAFVGYGVARQSRYVARHAKLYAQLLRAPEKAELFAQLQALPMPYGAAGVLLTSYPTIMVLAISITMCLCMTFFLYFNRRLVFENTTVIESIFVDERRLQGHRGTATRYRNPYDLGGWLNFVDMFTTAGDPLVRRAMQRLDRGDGGGGGVADDGCGTMQNADPSVTAAAPAGEQQRRGGGWCARVQGVLSRVGLVVWLVGFPTLRPVHGDGVHYATFDALAAGEQRSFLRS